MKKKTKNVYNMSMKEVDKRMKEIDKKVKKRLEDRVEVLKKEVDKNLKQVEDYEIIIRYNVKEKVFKSDDKLIEAFEKLRSALKKLAELKRIEETYLSIKTKYYLEVWVIKVTIQKKKRKLVERFIRLTK